MGKHALKHIKYNRDVIYSNIVKMTVDEFLKIVEADSIIVKLNTPLSATVFAPDSEEDYIYLVMPVQLRS